MDRFSKLHPTVHLLFFVVTFAVLMSAAHPCFCSVSLVGALAYCAVSRGRAFLSKLGFSAAVIFFVTIFNFIFAHYGESVLFTVGDTCFTAQAAFFGFNQGMTLAAALLWFGVLSDVSDSRRIIYFLPFAPKTALVFSMVLGFLPRFRTKAGDIRAARLALSGGEKESSFRLRLKNSVLDFSGLITYCLESSILTANSMNARGYNPSAVRRSHFHINVIDILLSLFFAAAGILFVIKKTTGGIVFVFDPQTYSESLSVSSLILFSFCQIVPTLTDGLEEIMWKLSAAKI